MVSTSRVPDAARTAPTTPRLAVAAALALTLVTGCTSSTDPSPSPTVTEAVATPTPTPTPTSTASPKPERPAAMDDVSVEGAIAVATYFISLYPYVYNTGDLTEWNTLSHPECIFCASVVEGVTEMHASERRIEGASVTVTSSTGVDVTPGYFYSVELDARQRAGTEVDAMEEVWPDESAEKRYTIAFVVLREADAWRIRGVEANEIDE
ncbi:DUF6318 family protein [Cellulomonas sp. P22]|uniref:DUF6318 family protein n=1 Tax=Cellulomonas sp. P22 TaxID=3373189 RepID=UPI00379D6BEA